MTQHLRFGVYSHEPHDPDVTDVERAAAHPAGTFFIDPLNGRRVLNTALPELAIEVTEHADALFVLDLLNVAQGVIAPDAKAVAS
jgi:hypothetical protein